MKFLDQAKIFVKSGEGGAGAVSFRREKYVEFGGPDGGNGGRGGDVIIECVDNLNTLIDYRYQQHFKAQKGMHGMGKNRTGAKGEDVVLKVPVGTQVLAEDKETILADLTAAGQRITVLKGGDGGFGNLHFTTSTNQAPRKSTPGWPGQETWMWLRLKLIADCGLVGLPNAGKSTLLAAVSRARPKIASYPFTTLHPNLGVVYMGGDEFIMADIPGLIEGAHEGAGIGDRFLGHVERCRVLLHLVDGTEEDVAESYRVVRGELAAYGGGLAEKPEVLVLNKIDSLVEEEIAEKKAALEAASGAKVLVMSGVAGMGLKEALGALLVHIKESKAAEPKVLAAATVSGASKKGNDGFFRRLKDRLAEEEGDDEGYWGKDGEWIWYDQDADQDDLDEDGAEDEDESQDEDAGGSMDSDIEYDDGTALGEDDYDEEDESEELVIEVDMDAEDELDDDDEDAGGSMESDIEYDDGTALGEDDFDDEEEDDEEDDESEEIVIEVDMDAEDDLDDEEEDEDAGGSMEPGIEYDDGTEKGEGDTGKGDDMDGDENEAITRR